MNKVIASIFALVLIGTGVTFLPAVKEVTDNVFSGLGPMSTHLTFLVSIWPVIILLFFVFGAYMLVRGRRQ